MSLPAVLSEIQPDDYGPKLAALTPRQRAFVLLKMQHPTLSHPVLVKMAGYNCTEGSARVIAYELTHSEKVLAAIKEVAQGMLHSGAILGAGVLVEIAMDANHKDRFKAAESLLSRSGLGVISQHEVTVHHINDAEKIEKIKLLTQKLGFDKEQTRALLGSAGVVDAEFSVVDPARAKLDEDWSIPSEEAPDA